MSAIIKVSQLGRELGITYDRTIVSSILNRFTACNAYG